MAILVAADFNADEWAAWWPALTAALPGEELLRDVNEAQRQHVDVALVANPPVGALQGLPQLRFVQSLWAGVDRLLQDSSVPLGLPLARMVDPSMNITMAETALWAVIGLHRHVFRYAAQQRAAEWRQHAQQRAGEVSVLVLGLGQMGRAAAQAIARQGYRVSGWSTRPAVIEGVHTASGEAALHTLLADAHIVVNLLPLTPATRGLFGAASLVRMRRGASLVNLARGAHVVDADLIAALDSGHLEHAVLDVFATEPLPADHPYWRHAKVTVLPHVAAQTDPRSAALIAADNVRAFRAGRTPLNLVDRTRGY
ncbi:MAG: glyoxylate/hydroxypyruvate reductase A [Burkholderiales bacterium]